MNSFNFRQWWYADKELNDLSYLSPLCSFSLPNWRKHCYKRSYVKTNCILRLIFFCGDALFVSSEPHGSILFKMVTQFLSICSMMIMSDFHQSFNRRLRSIAIFFFQRSLSQKHEIHFIQP